jgi:hypothetical protein
MSKRSEALNSFSARRMYSGNSAMVSIEKL